MPTNYVMKLTEALLELTHYSGNTPEIVEKAVRIAQGKQPESKPVEEE